MKTRKTFIVAVLSLTVLVGLAAWTTSSTGTALAAAAEAPAAFVSSTSGPVDSDTTGVAAMDNPWCCCPQPWGCIQMGGCTRICPYVGDLENCNLCAISKTDEEEAKEEKVKVEETREEETKADSATIDVATMDNPWCCCPEPWGCIQLGGGCGICGYAGTKANCALCMISSEGEQSTQDED